MMKRLVFAMLVLTTMALLAGCPPAPPPVSGPGSPPVPQARPAPSPPVSPSAAPVTPQSPPPATPPGVTPPAAGAVSGGPHVSNDPEEAAREQAQQSQCLSQVKQIALASLMYCQDYDERMAPHTRWTAVLQPYMKNTALYRCPSAPRLPVGYGYNKLLSFKSLGSIPRPSETPLLMDANIGGANPVVQPNWERASERRLIKRHGGGSNVGFTDGHCKWMQAP